MDRNPSMLERESMTAVVRTAYAPMPQPHGMWARMRGGELHSCNPNCKGIPQVGTCHQRHTSIPARARSSRTQPQEPQHSSTGRAPTKRTTATGPGSRLALHPPLCTAQSPSLVLVSDGACGGPLCAEPARNQRARPGLGMRRYAIWPSSTIASSSPSSSTGSLVRLRACPSPAANLPPARRCCRQRRCTISWRRCRKGQASTNGRSHVACGRRVGS